MAKYRIVWQYKTPGGTQGQGTKCFSYDIVKEMVKEQNDLHPEIRHWVEPCD